MHLYNAEGQIKKYDNTSEILDDFYETRLMMYSKRKEYLINKLMRELDILKYKRMFIEYVLEGKIIIYRQKKADIINRLVELKFPKFATSENNETTYDYITDMPLFNLTQDKIDELNEKLKNKEEELGKIQSTTEIEQWKYELNELETKYKEWCIIHSNLDNKPTAKAKSKAKAKAKI